MGEARGAIDREEKALRERERRYETSSPVAAESSQIAIRGLDTISIFRHIRPTD